MSATVTRTLYEMTDALAQVMVWLEESEGEVTEEIAALLDLAEGDFTTKAQNVALMVREKLARAKMAKDEADRLLARSRAATNAADSLKQYLAHEMERAGKTRIDAPLVTLAFQASPPSVVAPAWDEEALKGLALAAPQFVTHKETFALNRARILEEHKAGRPIPEGVTIERTSSLRIR